MFCLYLVSQNNDEIDAVQVTGCNNEKVASELKKTKKLCLAPNPEVSNEILTQVKIYLKRPFEVLTSSTSSTSDYMEQMTQLQSKNSRKSSKSFKNISTKYQNIFLVPSSVGEITEVNYNAEAV